jgi:hypothetical protein
VGKRRGVADVAEYRAGDDRPDAVDAGDRGSGRGHRLRGAAFGVPALLINAVQVGDQFPGELEFRLRDRGIGDDAVEELDRLARSHVLASSPPGTSSHSTAWTRHTAWVRSRPRS